MQSLRLTGLKTALTFIKAAGGSIHDGAMYVARHVQASVRAAPALILFDEFCVSKKEDAKVQPCDWWDAGIRITMSTDSLTVKCAEMVMKQGMVCRYAPGQHSSLIDLKPDRSLVTNGNARWGGFRGCNPDARRQMRGRQALVLQAE
eukprot:2640243-Rhodomonas_salina.1